MITSAEAEVLAHTTVENYVAQCGCMTTQDLANVLMKLASMCGIGMAAVVGQEEAVSRMQGTTDHIANAKLEVEWTRTPIQ